VAVALGQPLRRPLVGGSADHGGELGLDEGLVDGLGGLADAVVHLRRLECVQDLQQGRLVKGHRGLGPFASTIGLVSLTIARWPLQSEHLRRRSSATYTTRWDATWDEVWRALPRLSWNNAFEQPLYVPLSWVCLRSSVAQRCYQGESWMLDSPEGVCPGQARFEYPATSVLFSIREVGVALGENCETICETRRGPPAC
jgi:hypothetical protein